MLCDELKVYVPQDGPWGLEPEEGGKLVEEETCYLKSDVDAAIAELKQQLEDVQASAYAESVDAGMRERRLKRSLFLMGARLGKMGHLAFHSIWAKLFYLEDEEGMRRANIRKDQWKNVELKFRAMAEEYK